MVRVESFLDRSSLSDPRRRAVESEYLYIDNSSENLSENFLRIRDWRNPNNIYKYQLTEKERRALFSERAVLNYGFSHGEKSAMIYFLTGLGGEHLSNLLKKATAKIMVLDMFFKKTIEMNDEFYKIKLGNFVDKIGL